MINITSHLNEQKYFFSLKNLVYILLFCQCFLSFLVLIIIQNYAYYLFNLTSILIIILLCRKVDEIAIALLFFLIYSLFNLIGISLNDLQYGVPFTFPDESSFYGISNYYIVNPKIPNWSSFHFIELIDVVDWIGYHYIISPIGYIFSKFDENSFLALRQVSVFFGTLSIVYIYKLILFFHNNKKESFYGALLFGFLPYMLLYSSVLLRDIIILFFTVFTIVNLVKLNRLNFFINIPLVFFSLFLLFYLRPENGIFTIFICFIYLMFLQFVKFNKSSKIILSIIFIFIFFAFLIFFYDDLTYRLFKTIRRYREKSLFSVSNDSLGAILYTIPIYIQAVIKTFLSQLQPFPFWYHIDQNVRVVDMLGGVLWFGIFLFSLITITINKLRMNISRELLILYILSIIYIMLVSMGTMNPRRLFIFYPIIYTVAYIGFLQLSNYSKKLYVVFLLCSIFLLHVVYLILKNGMNL